MLTDFSRVATLRSAFRESAILGGFSEGKIAQIGLIKGKKNRVARFIFSDNVLARRAEFLQFFRPRYR